MSSKIHLPHFKNCTGCMACHDTCKQNAIVINKNNRGFYQIDIDYTKCIQCKKCEKVCPVINPPTIENYTPNAYIGWSLSNNNLLRSASGGIFIELALSFIKIYQHSIVYGAVWNQETEQLSHKFARTSDEIIQFQNSKYLQSNVSNTYTQVKQHLQESNKVLFSGTPCQIGGLLNFLPKKLHKNLYTIEIICHGVPSFDVLNASKDFYKASQIVSFRTKKDGWELSQKCTYRSYDKELLTPNKGSDVFYNMFLSEYFLRPACMHCPFAKLPRIADITLGDYWGDNKIKNKLGTSLFFINNSRALDFISTANIFKKEINFIESLHISSRMTCNLYSHLKIIPRFLWVSAFIKGKKRNLFYKIYFKIWNKLIQKAQKRKKNIITKAILEYENYRNHNNS